MKVRLLLLLSILLILVGCSGVQHRVSTGVVYPYEINSYSKSKQIGELSDLGKRMKYKVKVQEVKERAQVRSTLNRIRENNNQGFNYYNCIKFNSPSLCSSIQAGSMLGSAVTGNSYRSSPIYIAPSYNRSNMREIMRLQRRENFLQQQRNINRMMGY